MKSKSDLEAKLFETDGMGGIYCIKDLRESKYILYSCSRKSFLLPSDEISMAGLTKIEFDYSNPIYRRYIYEPLEKLMGRHNIKMPVPLIINGKYHYTVKILNDPELELTHWRPGKI